MRNKLIVGMLLILSGGATAAVDSDRLATLLRGVEEQGRFSTPLRADGELTVTSPDGSQQQPVILLYRSGVKGTDLYIELHSGAKALILGDGAEAFRLNPGANKAEAFPADATLADSDFAREDFEPFRLSRLIDARITDDNAAQLTITIVPKPSQYSLEVVTIDIERKLALKTLYYHETGSNLVKMERDSDHVLIGQRWLPTKITMEGFKLRTLSTLTLKWSQNPTFPPELFDPAFLSRPSGLQAAGDSRQ